MNVTLFKGESFIGEDSYVTLFTPSRGFSGGTASRASLLHQSPLSLLGAGFPHLISVEMKREMQLYLSHVLFDYCGI